MSTRGYDDAPMVPVGATIVRVYWCLPETYMQGEEYPTEEAAIRAGIARYEAAEDKHCAYAGHGRDPLYVPLPESFAVDLRWKMQWRPGSRLPNGLPTVSAGVDTVIRRTTYANLAEAREHADRIAATAAGIARSHADGGHRPRMPSLCPACDAAPARDGVGLGGVITRYEWEHRSPEVRDLYRPADGSRLPVSEFPDLAALLGDRFGPADGETVALPDLRPDLTPSPWPDTDRIVMIKAVPDTEENQ